MSNEADGQNANASQSAGGQQAAGGQGGSTDQTMAEIAAGIQDQQKTSEAGDKNASKQQQQSAQSGLPENMQQMQDYFNQQAGQLTQLRKTVEDATATLNDVADRENKRILNEAVDNAVAKINEGVDGNAGLADTFLNHVYQNNPDFKKIFDNRDENPGALDKALGMLKEEWKGMNTKQIDSQVAENQRALQESQGKGGTAETQSGDEDARLEKLSDGDFMNEMRALAASGG